MNAIVLRADARSLPLPDRSVDLIVTSPPYFGLRSYTDGGEHYDGQVGSEATPAEFITALLACTREWLRVLKPTGSLLVNLGDKYASGGRASYDRTDLNGARGAITRPRDDAPPKTLLGLPWRYALGCTDDLGLILRAEIVWSKPNGMPESVTDRVRRSHEQVFHFVRQPRYYAAVDEIREPHETPAIKMGRRHGGSAWSEGGRIGSADGSRRLDGNPLGKLPGSVWGVPSQPLIVPPALGLDHFAAFPMELPRRIIAGWSPPGICTGCGEGRRPVVDKVNRPLQKVYNGRAMTSVPGAGRQDYRTGVMQATEATITGYECGCASGQIGTDCAVADPCHGQSCPACYPDRFMPAPTRPAIVLDPFAGTGTTLLVADALGRTGVGVDRSADYCRLARWRTTDPGERAKAMQVPKPPPVPDGQNALFPREAS